MRDSTSGNLWGSSVPKVFPANDQLVSESWKEFLYLLSGAELRKANLLVGQGFVTRAQQFSSLDF